MVAVSDTGPIHYLILVDSIHILPELFEQVLIPQAVIDELSHERAPESVRLWVTNLPPWAAVCIADEVDEPINLGKGEREVILLCEQMSSHIVLMDDSKASKIARARGHIVAGTLSLLLAASKRELVNLNDVFARLEASSFFVSPGILQAILDQQ